jgi:hypothetical protein
LLNATMAEEIVEFGIVSSQPDLDSASVMLINPHTAKLLTEQTLQHR